MSPACSRGPERTGTCDGMYAAELIRVLRPSTAALCRPGTLPRHGIAVAEKFGVLLGTRLDFALSAGSWGLRPIQA
eukprot:scaffold28687_cov65-Phaeocystis_antarctica.AAC.5